MTDHGFIAFRIPGYGDEPVPVDIWDHRGGRISTLSSKSISIQPGQYVITAQLPGGTPLWAEATVDPKLDVMVDLRNTSDDLPPAGLESLVGVESFGGMESLNLAKRLSVTGGSDVRLAASELLSGNAESRAIQAATSTNEQTFFPATVVIGSAPAEMPSERVQFIAGNVFPANTAEPPGPKPPAADGRWIISGGDAPQYVQVGGANGINAYMALPAGGSAGCELWVAPPPSTETIVKLLNPSADMLLRYESAGMRHQSRVLAEQVFTAEKLMRGKFEDPISAAVGGYALLRFRETEHLDVWANNLTLAAPWLPDGYAVLGEYLAQQGRHDEALAAFLKIETSGLPLFSYGLTRALGRLRTYSGAMKDSRGSQAKRLVRLLQCYSSVCEFSNPLTNFMGISPWQPGLAPENAVAAQDLAGAHPEQLQTQREDSMARYPGAVWMPISGASGSYTGGPFKIVHHTTEGSSANAAFDAFRNNRSDPHFTVDENNIYQHIDTSVAARALRNPSGGVQTNRDSAVQIEVVGFAHRRKSKATLRNVARLCRWIEQTHGIPKVWPNGPPKPAKNGQDPGGHNRNAQTWDTKGGHYGHSNVPENDHWDPGYLPEEVEFLMTFTGTEAVADANPDFASIPERDPGLAGDYSRMPDHNYGGGSETRRRSAAPPLPANQEAVEGSRIRLNSLMQSMGGDIAAAVDAAIRSGQVSLARFGLAAAPAAPRGGDFGVFAMEAGPGAETVSSRGGFEFAGNPIGIEAIVRAVGRPPMLIRDDRVEFKPVKLLPQLTEGHVRRIEHFIPSVGRVEFVNHMMSWGGTGFVVGEGSGGRRRVVTNRHVAKLVARRARDGQGIFLRSPIGLRYGAKLDMRKEAGSVAGSAFELPVAAITYLADDTAADVAVLEIEVTDGLMPEPIPLAARRGRDKELVATIGYPAYDDRNDVTQMRQYFNDLYDVKRFAPGLIMTGGEGTVLSHDCTTLGGNSGSCLISLEQDAVVGLHFSGDFGVQNAAVSSETLKKVLAGQTYAVPAGKPSLETESKSDGQHAPQHFNERTGYDPDFLGSQFKVALPTFGEEISADLAQPSDQPAGEFALRYTHFSVLFSAGRKSPRVTAVNIDGEKAVRIKRGDDQWFFDLRIPREIQLGQKEYADPEIDRGHMVRREDPNWGDTAQQANDDTFHYTNSALQHAAMNQGKTLWQGLENYILDNARTKEFRASVFTGPVLRGDDPELEEANAQIPQEFWKIVVMLDNDNRLHATAYLLSQGELIRDLLQGRSRSEAVEGFVLGAYRTFQVAVRHIEGATGLDFGDLRSADPMHNADGSEAAGASDIAFLPLESLDDIRLDRQILSSAGTSAFGAAPVEAAEFVALAADVAKLESKSLLSRLVTLQDEADEDDAAASTEIARLFQRYHAETAMPRLNEEAQAPDFSTVKDDYLSLYTSCKVRPAREGEVAWYVKTLKANQARYEKVGETMGIPWWFVGITHALEGSFNFKGHLHNGDPLSARTVQVPKGRPAKWNPPNDWESSAVDALSMMGYAGKKDWSLARSLYRFEAYNGWGYRSRGVNSPYLWSFSTHYSKGKFVKDGKYDSNAVSKQCGAAVMLKALGV